MDQTLEERVQSFNIELAPVLKKYNLSMGATATFPIYKILPVEVDLALEVLKKHGVQYHVAFRDRIK